MTCGDDCKMCHYFSTCPERQKAKEPSWFSVIFKCLLIAASFLTFGGVIFGCAGVVLC